MKKKAGSQAIISGPVEDLHVAIFEAFDRFVEHLYVFQFGKGPLDLKGKRQILDAR